MSDNNQPPLPPQGPPVPPPHDHAEQPEHDASGSAQPAEQPASLGSEPPAPAQPAYDPNGYQQAAPQQPAAYDPNGYQQSAHQQPSAPQTPSWEQAAPQPAFDPNAYQQAPPPSPYGQGGYQQAPQHDPNAYPQQPGYPAGPGYAPGGYNPNYDPQAKSRVVAGILGILLGAFGVHRFYLGYTGMGILMLGLYLLGLITSWLGVGLLLMAGVGIWALVEGILILTKSPSFQNDATGRPLRDG